MAARTYGTMRLDGSRWELDKIEPHVSLRLKQMFPSIPTAATPPYHLPHTDNIDADLDWFLIRYPLAMSDADRATLSGGCELFRRKMAELEEILLPTYRLPAVMGLRPGEVQRHYQGQAVALVQRRRSLLLGDEGGLGKAQPLTAKVLTPSGWKDMGDLRVGDEVVDPDGGTGTVTGVFDRGIRDSYRITLSDEASTECCDEHLWLVQTENDRFRKVDRVLPLKDFMGRLRVERQGHGIRSRYFIPCGTVDIASSSVLPIKPYLLGAIIGNGCLRQGAVKFSSADPETLAMVSDHLPDGSHIVHHKGYDYSIIGQGNINPILDRLRAIDLYGKLAQDKAIPPVYMLASAADRMELLRGLMDTDGDCTTGGVSIFTTTSQVLSSQVVDLVRSLGGIATVYRSEGNFYTYNGERRRGIPSFRVNVRLAQNPFHLPRKAGRWKRSILARAVRSVEFVGPKPMRCIAVSTKRNLYFTDGYIVTHNTYIAGQFISATPEAMPALVVCDAHMPVQWKEKLEKHTYLRCHIITTGTPFKTVVEKKARKKVPYDLPPADVYIISYSKLAGWVNVIGTGMFKAVIYDEIQALRRGTESQKGCAAREASRHALYRLGLTATPIYNYGAEIWRVMQFIDAETLGSFEDFFREWCTGTSDGGRLKDPKALGTYLREQHVFLRRVKADVGLELPKVSRIVEHVEHDAKALASIEDLARSLALRAVTGDFTDRGQAARELDLRVRQQTGVAKARGVAQFVRLLVEAGEPVLLMGWHRECYDIWLRELEDLKPAMYTGSESVRSKVNNVEAFTSGATNLLIMSLRSGAGVDGLQHRCSTVVFGELDWSPGVHQQVIWRVDRDGQMSPVTVFFLVTDDGSDPPMMEVLGIKASEATGVVDPNLGVQVVDTDTTNLRRLVERYLDRKHQGAAGRGVAEAETAPSEQPETPAFTGIQAPASPSSPPAGAQLNLLEAL